MVYTDQRSKILSEMIAGIRLIKFYAWENYIMKKIFNVRK